MRLFKHIIKPYLLSLLQLFLKIFLCFDFFTAISILQNGDIPKFISEKGLQEIFTSDDPGPGYVDIRKAFKEFGLYQVFMFD